ncbi:MAG: DUF4432 family protein [Phycisphaerales bacterium]|nr:DUF4432 family protein [Phycisphaerales bacterium]
MTQQEFDNRKFINPAQAGGIEAYTLDDGAGRGVRALCINTGGGLRYRVLVDRGLDIDQAFYNQHSLTFLTHRGATAPTRGLDSGVRWLKGFPGGLLTSCGPFNICAPCNDQGEELGLHGEHSNTAASLDCVVQPDPHLGKDEMSISGVVRYGAFNGPCLELRRTIRSKLGQNRIDFVDEFYNAGNKVVSHAWLLHINFGYPLVDEGSELCVADKKVEPMDNEDSIRFFSQGRNYKRLSKPAPEGKGAPVVGYLYPKAARNGATTVGIVNRKLNLGVAIHYNTGEFGRCGNWQSLMTREYVTALEPMTGKGGGRHLDRAEGLVIELQPGARRNYHYSIEVANDKAAIESLRALNH